jgi:hypothetical protein
MCMLEGLSLKCHTPVLPLSTAEDLLCLFLHHCGCFAVQVAMRLWGSGSMRGETLLTSMWHCRITLSEFPGSMGPGGVVPGRRGLGAKARPRAVGGGVSGRVVLVGVEG